VARRRSKLEPSGATNEGARQLRELLVRQTFGALARRLRCDEGAVRHYAREKRKPNDGMRERIFTTFGIPYDAWDKPPSSDLYAGADPVTTRRV
jgi:hypothetical protein